MRTVTLVRHAKSSWDEPGLSDFERPLNARGKRDAPRMAARAVAAGWQPERLVSSPALRALATARIFAQALHLPSADIQLVPAIYEASPQALLDAIRELNAHDRDAMLFGHNPGISQAAHLLARCPFDEMPTCALVRLRLDVKGWADVAPGCGTVLAYEYPKKGAD